MKISLKICLKKIGQRSNESSFEFSETLYFWFINLNQLLFRFINGFWGVENKAMVNIKSELFFNISHNHCIVRITLINILNYLTPFKKILNKIAKLLMIFEIIFWLKINFTMSLKKYCLSLILISSDLFK